ncbi:MAG: bifunctional UDP-sugar hydrolase/5'-nucleotidase [Kiritimatiellia bacterium]
MKTSWKRPAALLLAGLCSWMAVAQEVSLVILHTADMHGNLLGAGVIPSSRTSGGLMRCATLIEKIRGETGNVLLLDCGDIFQGSPESFYSKGMVVADAVRLLEYDALVVGNHEFDWGLEQLMSFYQRACVPALAADILIAGDAPDSASASRPAYLQPFIIREYEGLRVAVIGLSNPHIPHWFQADKLGNLAFMDSVEALRAILPYVREKQPHLIILAAHQGYRSFGDNPANRINAIALNFPEIDLIIGAHTHDPQAVEAVRGIMYTQSGPYGKSLGRVDLTFDLQQRQITARSARLIEITDDVPRAPYLEKELAEPLHLAMEAMDEVIGAARHDIGPRPAQPGQSAVQSLIAEAVARSTRADVVLHGTLSDATLYEGPVRGRDIWSLVPYENNIWLADLTAAEIREILEENAGYFGSSQFRGIYGATYDLDLRGAAPRVERLNICSRPAEAATRYTVAINSFDAASAGGRLPRLRTIIEKPSSRARDTGRDTRGILLEFVRDNSPVAITPAAGAVTQR